MLAMTLFVLVTYAEDDAVHAGDPVHAGDDTVRAGDMSCWR